MSSTRSSTPASATSSSTSTSVAAGCSCMGECCVREWERLRVAQKRLDLQKEHLVLNQEMLEADRKNFRKTAKLASKNKSISTNGNGNNTNDATTSTAGATHYTERDRTRQLELEQEVETLRSQLQNHRQKEEQWQRLEKEQTESIAASGIAVVECSRELNMTILELEKYLGEAKHEIAVLQEAHAKEKERWETGILEFVKSESVRTIDDCSSSEHEQEIKRLNLLVEKCQAENKHLREESNHSLEQKQEQKQKDTSEALRVRVEWLQEKEKLDAQLREQNKQIDNWKLLLPRNKVLLERTESKNKQLVKELEEIQIRSIDQADSIAELKRQLKTQKQEREQDQEMNQKDSDNDNDDDDDTQEEHLAEGLDTISLEDTPCDTGNRYTYAPNAMPSSVPQSSSTILLPMDFTPEKLMNFGKAFVIESEWTNKQNRNGLGGGGLYTGWVDSEGNPSGNGTLRIDDGGIYTGQWKEGLRSGNGVYTSIDGALYYGPWLNDRFQGRGVYVSEINQVYTGDWTDGFRHGTGIETWEHGARYTGHYHKDKKHGRFFFSPKISLCCLHLCQKI